MSLKARLRKLEKSVVDTGRRVTDPKGGQYVTFDEASVWIAFTMSQEHREIVLGEIQRYKNWWKTDPLIRRGSVPSFSHLTDIFNQLVKQAASINLCPYALPPEVAEVYIKDTQAYPEHECEKCGYQVPLRNLTSSGEFKRYFPQCPLCGGTTGEGLWPNRIADLPWGLKTNSIIYKIRRMRFHEVQIEQYLNNPLIKEPTRRDAIEVLFHEYPDLKKYIS